MYKLGLLFGSKHRKRRGHILSHAHFKRRISFIRQYEYIKIGRIFWQNINFFKMLKGQCHEILQPQFFLSQNYNLIDIRKYLRIWCCFGKKLYWHLKNSDSAELKFWILYSKMSVTKPWNDAKTIIPWNQIGFNQSIVLFILNLFIKSKYSNFKTKIDAKSKP